MAYAAYLVLCVFALTELALRLFDPLGIEYALEMHRFVKQLREEEVVATTIEPGLDERFAGVRIVANDLGFRGPGVERERSPGVKRVMVLGDSIAFGWGVEAEEMFGARLAELLRGDGVEIEVMTCAVCSWNTRTQYEFLRNIGVDYRPDLVLLNVVENDLEVKRSGRTGIPRDVLEAKRHREKSALQNAREDVWRAFVKNTWVGAHVQHFARLRREAGVTQPDSPGWWDARLALDGIVDLCRERGIELLVYFYSSDEKLARGHDPFPLYRAHLDARGVPVHTLPHEVITERAYHNSVIDVHPNALGHESIATEMARELRARLAAGDQS